MDVACRFTGKLSAHVSLWMTIADQADRDPLASSRQWSACCRARAGQQGRSSYRLSAFGRKNLAARSPRPTSPRVSTSCSISILRSAASRRSDAICIDFCQLGVSVCRTASVIGQRRRPMPQTGIIAAQAHRMPADHLTKRSRRMNSANAPITKRRPAQ